MKVAVFSVKRHDRESLSAANAAAGQPHQLSFFEAHLDARTAALATGADAICPFVNDRVDRATLASLHEQGVRLIALRSAGFNNVDLGAAEEFGIRVARVPAYSPWAVAEHAAALILALNRKTHRAYARVREGNFALDGLLGFDLHGRTVGLVGVGRIGLVMARIMTGFGCAIIAHDPERNPELEALGGRYASLDELFSSSDIISLHCPLTPETRHLIDKAALDRMKRGVMLINTSRGAVVDTKALGENTIKIDCDVLQADGGTRTAAITGGYLALHDALARRVASGDLAQHPLTAFCAAISVGVVGGVPVCDLPYPEDSTADVDMNVVMTSEGSYVELQGTAEGAAFGRPVLDELLRLAEGGIAELIEHQRAYVADAPAPRPARR